MTRHGATILAAMSLWLSGCASVVDFARPADPLLARFAERLDHDWRPDPAWSPESDPSTDRWQLGGPPAALVDSLLAEWRDRPSKDRGEHPLFALSRRPGRVGTNATILLARAAPDLTSSVDSDLARLVTGESADSPPSLTSLLDPFRDKDAPPKPDRPSDAARAAAAETWCRRLSAGDGPIEDRLAAPGRAWTRTDLPDLVRAELLRSLARHLPPERIVGYGDLFAGGTSKPSDALRHAAIDGCVLFAAAHPDRPYSAADWPVTIENAHFNVDPHVRRGYGRWLALARHPESVPLLVAQLQDTDTNVVTAAIESLGRLRTDAARDALRVVAAKPAETHRAAAASALAAWGPVDLERLMKDESPHVRRAAVSALARCPSPEAAVLLDSVIDDRDLDVQRNAVAATSSWPDDLALPVLFAGLYESAVRTRRECLEELRRRTGYDDPFPVTGELAERETALRTAAAGHGWPLDGMTRFRLANAEATAEAEPTQTDVAPLLTRLADPVTTPTDQTDLIAKLREAGPAAVAPVETFCLDHPGPTADRLLAEALPSLSPAHAAATELASDDVATRRRAAGRLAELGRSSTLSPLVLRRMRERLTREQDGLVWRQAMAAIASDATADAEGIALLAVNNPWPDVRRLGCEYVGRHGRAPHAAWLVPRLSDDNDAVRLAAIEALGRCGSAAGTATSSGLHDAAAGSDRAARFAALAALARLGDESGTAGLLRWAEYEAPSERIKAVRAIAGTGRRRFEPDLARLAWTERDALVRRELLSALETLVPPAQRPPGHDASAHEDRIRAWASRWEAPPASSTMPAPGPGPAPAAPGPEPEPMHVR